MAGSVLMLISATMLFAGVVSYVVARRYGWKPALALPLLALAASIAMLWQAGGAGLGEGLGLAANFAVIAAPTLVGALAGVLIARLRRE